VKRRALRARRLPWWLEPGGEPCEACLVLHHVELMIRCDGCDELVCSACVIERRDMRGSLCLRCAEELG
jgi:hypothetical protein